MSAFITLVSYSTLAVEFLAESKFTDFQLFVT